MINLERDNEKELMVELYPVEESFPENTFLQMKKNRV